MAATLEIGFSKSLKISDVWNVAHNGQRVSFPEIARTKVKLAHEFLLSQAQRHEPVYGVNTGFGLLSNVKVEKKDLKQLQYNLLRSHAVGTGAYLDDVDVRAMLLLRAHALAQGFSGVSPQLIELLISFLNFKICPLVPEQGSVGASGDLAPLAHLALGLIGEGRVRMRGKEMTASQALRAAQLKPHRLGPKEGLALINGTQFMTALGALSLMRGEYLCETADLAGAMTIEALRGTAVAFDSKIQKLRPHPGQILAAQKMRELLMPGGKISAIAKSHKNCGKVQDPYSLRCIPQVHGAVRDTLTFVRQVLERELNAVTDNPLVFVKERELLSGGNFHGEVLAMALDFLAIALCELASISEQRIEKLVNPALSDLPAFLTKESGLNSGFMIVQVAAAALVSENKTLAHPASVDSIPTSADKEDHVSMGAWAARKAKLILKNAERVIGMELLAGAQGIDLLRPLRSSAPIEKAHALIRKKIKRLDQDRTLHPDLSAIEALIVKQVF